MVFVLSLRAQGDPLLREEWYNPVPPEVRKQLGDFAVACRGQGVRFGIGLSPLGALASFDEVIKQALLQRLRFSTRLASRT